jgi:membrane fusion protein, heavy metal efflux system
VDRIIVDAGALNARFFRGTRNADAVFSSRSLHDARAAWGAGMVKHKLLSAAGAVALVAAAGFLAGEMRASAAHSTAPAVTAASAPALPAGISVSSDALANMQLQIANSVYRPLVRTVQVTGTVGFDQQRVAQITPPARGRVETIAAVVGEHVQAGQQLAILDNFDLSGARSNVASAQAAVVQAQAQVTTAQAALQRAIILVGTGGMAQSQVEARRADMASAQAMLKTRLAELRQWQDTEQRLMPVSFSGASANSEGPNPQDSQGAIVAPFEGEVDAVNVSSGEIVDTSQQIFTVADLSIVWVQVYVPEDELADVRLGDQVAINVDAYPGRTFHGLVSYIADQVDPNTGTVAVRCEVPNPDEALRVNMFANASIASPLGHDAVLVPDAALQDVNGQTAVFIPGGRAHFTWQAVSIGLSSNGFTEITGGLSAGTPVVTNGSYWLKASLLAQTIPDEG